MLGETVQGERTLLCVAGLTPQIVTETLHCLVHGAPGRDPWVPDAIHIITTCEGAERLTLSLLDPEQGHFLAYCDEYGLDSRRIRFDSTTIHVIHDSAGEPLADIRSEDDNGQAADCIATIVRKLTQDDGSAIHASIAGGRKTMGFYLGYAMSLFGRPQDRLSHVLVSSPFESLSEFFYPPARPKRLDLGQARGFAHTRDARVTLADIPFVRLRGLLDDAVLGADASYRQVVERTQAGITPDVLYLDPRRGNVSVGTTTLVLPPRELALVILLARRRTKGRYGLSRQNATASDRDEFLAIYEDLPRASNRSAEAIRQQGLTDVFLQETVSRLRKRLETALGPVRARAYRVVISGDRAHGQYTLGLSPNLIDIA